MLKTGQRQLRIELRIREEYLSRDVCVSRVAVAETRGRFGKPEEG
jgi:hypothetical protein